MENKRVFKFAAILFTIMFLLFAGVGASMFLSGNNNGEGPVSMQFEEQTTEQGKLTVSLTLTEFNRDGHLEIELDNTEDAESESFLRPEQGQQVIIGDQLADGVKSGMEINVFHFSESGSTNLFTYTVTGESGSTTTKSTEN